MPKVYITRRVHFSAAHRLYSEKLSQDENESIFGLCTNPAGHGHNYELEVTVVGEPDPITGMVIDLKELKEIVNRELVDRVDHKHLNFDVDFLQGVVPTAENLVVAFWEVLKEKIPGGRLYELKLYETPRNVAIYRGE